MKRFLLGLMVAVFAVTLSGCFGDPVKDDLEKYRTTNNAIFAKMEKDIEKLEKKFESAQSIEEVTAIFGEMKVIVVEAQKKHATFQPKSDEVKVINNKITKGYSDIIADIDAIIAAAKAEDENKIMAAAEAVEKHADDIDKAENEIIALAKKKGLKWQVE